MPGEPLIPLQTLMALERQIDPLRLKTVRSNKRKSEEVNGEVKQEVMNVEKEEEELEEKVCAGTVGSQGLCQLLCWAATVLGLSMCCPGGCRALQPPLTLLCFSLKEQDEKRIKIETKEG